MMSRNDSGLPASIHPRSVSEYGRISSMTTIKTFSLFLTVACFNICVGCATLPNVSKVMDETSTGNETPQIASGKGLLSPEKSKAILERLKKSGKQTDILERHSAVIESVSDSPLTKGNKVTILVDGPVTYAAMFKAMEAATDHINLETFIIEDDEIGRKFVGLLLKKQAEGVQVNLIYDSIGSMGTPDAFFKRLRDAGIQVVEFNPVNPLKTHGKWLLAHPDHRKLLIVDGKVVFTGGINISEVYTSSNGYSSKAVKKKIDKKATRPWRDTDVQIEGPAVAEFQKLFIETWLKQKGPELAKQRYFPVLKEKGTALVRAIGSTTGEDNRLTFVAYVAAITFAEHSIHLTNAYFIPDDQILNALTDAAKRGVDVKIILPSFTDSSLALSAMEYNYSKLLKSGAKLYLRRHALLHAKTAVIDGVWSTVGSTNLDYWSSLSDDEVNAVILSRETAAEMEKMFAQDIAQSDQITWEKWKERPLLPMLKQWFSHFFDHLM
jgi:cardiolipin synthase A/B